MKNQSERADQVLQRINELASISEDDGFITRTYGTPAFLQGRSLLEAWMKAAGLQTRIDNIGNLRGRLVSANKQAKTLVIASHMDTVVNAGKFDGPMGILIGLDLLEQAILNSTSFPFHIELIAFCDEEGCRFHTTYLGSKAVAGSFDRSLLDARDAAGIPLADVITMNGGDVNKLSKDALAPDEWLGYFEIHIEQGPVLYEKNTPVAVVTAIAGQYRAGIVFNGEPGHAGTVPMKNRKDALACAAEFILAVESFAAAHAEKIVATVGKTHIINAASNVIPGEVICSLDLRGADLQVLDAAYEEIKRKCLSICERRGIVPEWSLIQRSMPVACDKEMNRLLRDAVDKAGYELIGLVSGAGHDAVPVSQVAPVSMLFVKCFKGISHNPAEAVEREDIEAAIKVADQFLEALRRHHSS